MPIYEFRCMKCNQIFELLKVNEGDDVEMRCPHCGSEDFERVLSAVSHTMGFGRGESRGPKVESRQCPSGTCTTYELPGHSRS